jgi:hypothetical protein
MLGVTHRETSARLLLAVSRAVREHEAGLVMARTGGSQVGLLVSVRPAREPGYAVVGITDLDEPPVLLSCSGLADLFGISRAEAEIAIGLHEGVDLAEIAARRATRHRAQPGQEPAAQAGSGQPEAPGRHPGPRRPGGAGTHHRYPRWGIAHRQLSLESVTVREGMMRRWATGLVLGFCVAAGAAHAESLALSVTSGAPNLGKVVRGAASTAFTITTAGVVSQTGPAIRISSGSVTAPTISITCNGNGHCNNRAITFTITAGGGPPARFTKFSVSCSSGCAGTTVSPVSGPSPLVFTLSGMNGNNVQFKVGGEVTVDALAASGVKTLPFTVGAVLP